MDAVLSVELYEELAHEVYKKGKFKYEFQLVHETDVVPLGQIIIRRRVLNSVCLVVVGAKRGIESVNHGTKDWQQGQDQLK